MDKITEKTDRKTVMTYMDTFIRGLVANAEPTGLDLDVETFLLEYVENQPATNPLTERIYLLMETVFSNERNQTEDVLRYFLGRGKGGTPAGDDHIIGLLAIHALTDALHPVFIQTVHDLIEQEAITTNASNYYLRHALNGVFLPPIALVVNHIGKNHQEEVQRYLYKLFAIGHSSGVDTSFGMLLGMLAIKNNTESQMN